MKYIIFIIFPITAFAQKTFLLSARDKSVVEFKYDTNYRVYTSNSSYVTGSTGIKEMEAHFNVSGVNDSFFSPPLYKALQMVEIKNIPLRAGKYIIYSDQNYYNDFTSLIFEVDDQRRKKIVSSGLFYEFKISEPDQIVFTLQK